MPAPIYHFINATPILNFLDNLEIPFYVEQFIFPVSFIALLGNEPLHLPGDCIRGRKRVCGCTEVMSSLWEVKIDLNIVAQPASWWKIISFKDRLTVLETNGNGI